MTGRGVVVREPGDDVLVLSRGGLLRAVSSKTQLGESVSFLTILFQCFGSRGLLVSALRKKMAMITVVQNLLEQKTLLQKGAWQEGVRQKRDSEGKSLVISGELSIRSQDREDFPAVERLLDTTFGVKRKKRPSYRFRNSVPPHLPLCLSGEDERGAVLASLQFWKVILGQGRRALLLGPLVVGPSLQGKGIGKELLRRGLQKAKEDGHALCFLVGEPSYYGAFGFVAAEPLGYAMTVPVESRKFLVCDLQAAGWVHLPTGALRPLEPQVDRVSGL